MKEAVVLLPVRFQVKTEVQQWFLENLLFNQEQGNQQPAEATIAIQKRVDRFELHVQKSGLDKRWDLAGVVLEEALEIAEARLHFADRGRHIMGIPRPGPAEPVLRASEFSGILGFASALLQQARMHVP
ncbi:hypothetical protein D9M68_604430 [compost metagenome]